MGPEAKRVWRSIAGDTHRLEVFTDWDRETFAVFCEAVVHHRKACELVHDSGVLFTGVHGNLVKNPALQVVRDSAQIIRSLAHQFGLTPSGRSGIALPPTADYEEARRVLS